MHPILFHLGPVPIPTYGAIAVLAFLVSVPVVRYYARLEGIRPFQMVDGIVFSCLAGIVGARALQACIEWEAIVNDPSKLVAVATNGGTFLGGVLTAIPFCVYWFRRSKLPFLPALDILAVMAAVSMGIARWGCYFAGCCYGHETTLPWGVHFPDIARLMHAGLPDAPVHPTQIYLSLASFAILAVLVVMYRNKRFDGSIGWTWLVLYGLTRLVIEEFRGDAVRGFVLGGALSTSQFISVVMIGIGASVYAIGRIHHVRSGAPDWQPAQPPAPSLPRAVARAAREKAKAARGTKLAH